ncbi:phospholipase D-like domain-containing protein [Candidatus Dependentiae bacterium]
MRIAVSRKCKCIAATFLLIQSLFCHHVEVLFSPGDHLASKLIAKIEAAKTKVWAAVYMITNKKIAQALIIAKERGLDVQVITDLSTVESPYGKAEMLTKAGIPVMVFCTRLHFVSKNKDKIWNNAPIMHNKFAIIDNIVWTGSFNWTVAADRKNRENVTILDDKVSLLQFSSEFGRLKRQSNLLGTYKTIRRFEDVFGLMSRFFSKFLS